jgi:hypothetical protein
VVCKLGASGRLTRALQTDKKDYVLLPALEFLRLSFCGAQHGGKFLHNSSLYQFPQIGHTLSRSV